VSSGSEVFDALLWRKSAQLAEPFIESLLSLVVQSKRRARQKEQTKPSRIKAVPVIPLPFAS